MGFCRMGGGCRSGLIVVVGLCRSDSVVGGFVWIPYTEARVGEILQYV